MADDERRNPDDPHLELPSLRSPFRRRRPEPEPAESQPAESQPGESQPGESQPGDTEVARTRHVSTRQQERGPAADPRPRRRHMPRPHLPGPIAAVLTGAVVGLVLVGLTSESLHLCTALRGTDSCGKPGILILLAITAVAILLGSLLLRLTGVAAHGSTSFLGVGLLEVVTLLALLPMLDEWWVVVGVPLLAMATFAVAWWLTSTYADPGERRR